MQNQEIERKFLINWNEFQRSSFFDNGQRIEIEQGFLSRDKERTVRVRKTSSNCTITVKGKSSKNGLARFEWQKQISEDDATALLAIALPGTIIKTRHVFEYEGFTWELDEFHGNHVGLQIAEVELNHVDQPITLPPFITVEVTGQKEFYNSYLSRIER